MVRYLADRIAVLYMGRLMEIGPAERVLAGSHHPYTAALLSAVPSLDGASQERIRLQGEMPSALAPPSGCVFHTLRQLLQVADLPRIRSRWRSPGPDAASTPTLR